MKGLGLKAKLKSLKTRSMAKPILVIAFPIQVEIEEMFAAVTPIDRRLEDYHVLAYRASNVSDLNFKVLNPGEASDLDIDALKKEIEEKIFNQTI